MQPTPAIVLDYGKVYTSRVEYLIGTIVLASMRQAHPQGLYRVYGRRSGKLRMRNQCQQLLRGESR